MIVNKSVTIPRPNIYEQPLRWWHLCQNCTLWLCDQSCQLTRETCAIFMSRRTDLSSSDLCKWSILAVCVVQVWSHKGEEDFELFQMFLFRHNHTSVLATQCLLKVFHQNFFQKFIWATIIYESDWIFTISQGILNTRKAMLGVTSRKQVDCKMKHSQTTLVSTLCLIMYDLWYEKGYQLSTERPLREQPW